MPRQRWGEVEGVEGPALGGGEQGERRWLLLRSSGRWRKLVGQQLMVAFGSSGVLGARLGKVQ